MALISAQATAVDRVLEALDGAHVVPPRAVADGRAHVGLLDPAPNLLEEGLAQVRQCVPRSLQVGAKQRDLQVAFPAQRGFDVVAQRLEWIVDRARDDTS